MHNSNFVKTITLLSFATLMALFILYRGGYLDFIKITQTSLALDSRINGRAISSDEQDSLSKKHDSIQRIMASSKSMVITDVPFLKWDSVEKQPNTHRETKVKDFHIMSSSKSGVVFPSSLSKEDSLYMLKMLNK